MASQSASPKWIWSQDERDHYYDLWDSTAGKWRRIWGKDRANTTPRTSHVSTGLSSGSSTVQPPGESAHPPPSKSEAAGFASITSHFERLSTNAVPETSSLGRNYGYQESTRHEPSGHRRNTASHSSHNSISGNRQGGPPYAPSSSFSQSTYASQNTPSPSYPIGGAYGSHQGAYASGWPSVGLPLGQSPQHGHHYIDHPALGHGNLNPTEFKQMIPSKSYFVVGRVFMMFYIENAGSNFNPPSDNASNFTSVPYGEWAHHQFRRFVVVRNNTDDLFSYCCPITTYSGKATTKPGVNQNAHTIVYSEKMPPPKLPGETRMNKDPLRIMVENPINKLDPKSRINLSKTIPIDHNHRVKTIGVVEPRSLAKLLHYVASVQNS